MPRPGITGAIWARLRKNWPRQWPATNAPSSSSLNCSRRTITWATRSMPWTGWTRRRPALNGRWLCDHQAGSDPSQVFDQGQPEHDRDGPQLAQFQGGYRLVSRDEGAQRLGINLRIHMRNQFEHQVIDARKPGGRT